MNMISVNTMKRRGIKDWVNPQNLAGRAGRHD
jgi:hypothetical protein